MVYNYFFNNKRKTITVQVETTIVGGQAYIF